MIIVSLGFSTPLFVPGAKAAVTTLSANSLIIPMDATYQNYGMFKAYGLVYKLLQSGIPVYWAIGSPKSPNTFGGVDFSATTIDDRTSVVIGAYNYSGGPFLIDSINAAAAQPVIDAWWAANGNQPVVHKATASFSLNVAVVLKSAPRIALDAVNSGIAINYFNAAGIPDSKGNVWSSSSPNVLSQTMIACNSPTGCAGDSLVGNGALFTNGACSANRYDTFITPHNGGYSYSLTDPTNLGTQAYAELDYFTYQGGGWTALCHSILSNENNINDLYRNSSPAVRALFKSAVPGGMLTQNGYSGFANVGGTWTVNTPNLPIAQAVTTTGAVQTLPGGSVQTWHAPDGTSNYAQYWSSVERTAYFLNNGVQYDWAINGPYHDGTGRGKITFLGGHSFSTALPYSTNYEAPYLRFFYNSLFFNSDVANIELITTPAAIPQGNTKAITIEVKNTGAMDAVNLTQPVTITLLPGITYVSTTGLQPEAVINETDGSTTLRYAAPGSVSASTSPIIVNATAFSPTAGTFKAATLNAAYSDVFGENFTSNGCTSVTITPAPGAAITKSPASLGPVNVGDTVTWTLSYSNPGSANLLTPYVEDILPPAFTYLSAAPAPTYIIPGASGTRLRWNLASPLAAGAAGSITLRAAVQTSVNQPFTNTAGLYGKDASGFIYNGSSSATVSVNVPQATLTKSVTPTGTVLPGATLTYTLAPNSLGPALFSGLRIFDAPPANTTNVNNVRPSNLGIFGPYPRISGVPGADTAPTTTLTLSGGAAPFTYALGDSLIVSMALNNAGGNSGPITNVTATLTPSDGVSTCVPLSAQPVSSIAVNSTANLTFTCTINSSGEITWDGDASGTYASAPYAFPTGSSPSILGVPTTTGTNVVQWIPTLNHTNTEAVPSTSFAAGVGPGLFTYNGSTTVWERYDIQTNAWITSPAGLNNNLPAATAAGAALVYDGGGYANGFVYAFRGGGTNTFWRYKLSDGTSGTWSALPPAAAPWNMGAGGALTKMGSSIYALQGNNTSGFARYDPASDSWTTLAPVPANVGNGGSLATDGTYLYALRGNGSNNFYRYNPTPNTWAAMANAPWGVNGGGGLTAIGGALYATRGNGSNNFATFVPNATTGKWTKLANLPAKVNTGGGVATDGSYVYVLRGANTRNLYRYNPTTKTWMTLANALANITTGGAVTFVPERSGATNSNSLSAPVLVTGSSASPATIQVIQTLTSSINVSGVLPSQLSVVSSMATPASATPAANCTVSPSTPQSITAGGTLTFTWTCTNVYQSGGNNANQNFGMLTFSAGATGAPPASAWSPATSNSVLVTQPLTYQVTVSTTPATFNQVTNQALLTDNLAFAQGVGSNSVVTSITRPPSVLVTKSVDPGAGTQVLPGNTLTYTLAVENTSPGQATSVIITDNVPSNTTYVSCTTSQGSCTQSGGTVTYAVGTLTGYGSASLTMVVTANTPAAAGLYTISNSASITYGGSGGPFSGASNPVSNTLLAAPAVTIAKTESANPAPDAEGRITPGSTITYTMTVNNPSGAVPATSVVATDPLPANTTYVSCTTSQGTCSQTDGMVTYAVGSMAANANVTLSMVVMVNNPALDGDTISNTASVAAETNVSGATYSAASNLVSYQIKAAPAIAITKSSNPASGSLVKTGDVITYTLVVKNTGDANTSSAYIQDAIPANTAYVPSSTYINGAAYPEPTPGAAPVSAGMQVYTAGHADPTGDGGTLVSENAPGGTANDATVTFQVIVTSPAGIARAISNTASAGTSTTPAVASNATTQSTPASISSRVWLDENSNGVADVGEAGIANIKVILVDSLGQTVAITTTDANGGYVFTSVPVGSYTVQVDPTSLPSGASYQTYDSDGLSTLNQVEVTVSLGAGEITSASFGYNLSNTTNVTGNTGLGSLGAQLWVDANGNGMKDLGEIGLAGAPVALITAGSDGLFGTADDTTAANTTSGPDGSYSFAGLPAGAYQVVVNGGVNPGGYTQTGDPDGALKDNRTTQPIILSPGDVFLNADFGYQPPSSSSLASTIYLDLNADGAKNSGEPGIPGVSIALVRESGDYGTWDPATEPVIATVVTGAGGEYSFTGLPAGNYLVLVADSDHVLLSLKQSGDPDGTLNNRTALSANGSSAYTNADFGYTPLRMGTGAGVIGDRIYLDSNDNGGFNAGEGLQGVTISLYNADGSTLLAQTISNENGSYYFGGLADGSYRVVVDDTTLPAGITNNQYPTGGSPNQSSTITISGGSVHLDQNFGYQGQNTVSGKIWNDLNSDGYLDSNETASPWPQGITLSLIDANGNTVATTLTGTNGDYSFTKVPDGTYKVSVTDTGKVLDSYWHSIGANPGQAGYSQPDSYSVTVSGGQTNNSAYFGYYNQPASLGNWIWGDTINNSIQDSSEHGIAGVTVTLTITYPDSSTTVLNTISDSSGHYTFTNLLLDETYDSSSQPTFVVSVPLSSGYYPAQVHVGGDPTVWSSDINGETAVLTRGSANANNNINFGLWTTPTAVLVWNIFTQSQPDGIRVDWDTENELKMVHFQLYRSPLGSPDKTLLTPDPIPVEHSGSMLGSHYQWVDTTAQPGIRYTYWLMITLDSGVETFFANGVWLPHQIVIPLIIR